LSIVFWCFVPESYRTRFIAVSGFLVLAFIQPLFSIFLFLLVLFVFWGGRILGKDTGKRSQLLILLILILVTVLVVFKYGRPIFELVFSSSTWLSKSYLVPIGLSYLSVKLIAYVLDIFRGTIEDPDLGELLAFIFFIPIFPAGPIERYQNFAGGRRGKFNFDFYAEGLMRIAVGYLKKVVIVNFALNEILLKRLHPDILANGISLDLPAWLVIAYLLCSLLYAYIDLSAYADIAIGFGQLFGYKIIENMNWPILQKNLGDYWNCWHISLSQWCRNNVYFPILGITRNITLALYSSFIVMGLWHNITVNWLLWGIWHATGVTIYMRWDRFKRKNKKIRGFVPKKVGVILGTIMTVLYAAGSFSFVMTEDPLQAFRILLAIFF
jgi:alginate O-acetyltransferase complex protein AlgI